MPAFGNSWATSSNSDLGSVAGTHMQSPILRTLLICCAAQRQDRLCSGKPPKHDREERVLRDDDASRIRARGGDTGGLPLGLPVACALPRSGSRTRAQDSTEHFVAVRASARRLYPTSPMEKDQKTDSSESDIPLTSGAVTGHPDPFSGICIEAVQLLPGAPTAPRTG